MADLREVLAGTRLAAAHHRPFSETLFQRGTRASTEAAHAYLNEKVDAEVFTKQEAQRIGRLIESYSFWR